MKLSVIIKKIRTELGLSQEGLACEIYLGFTSANTWKTIRRGN